VAITGKSLSDEIRQIKPNPEKFHGKEGVDGSSPSEGFAKFLLISPF
jgi:hypothetical protein